MTSPIVDVQDLSVSYRRGSGSVPAVDGVSLSVQRGERLAIIGESGSGKSTITQALLGVLAPNAELTAAGGQIDGVHLFDGLTEKQWNTLRRRTVAYVPQDPNIALNPVARVGRQLLEAIKLSEPDVEKADRETRAIERLEAVGLEDPRRVFESYPHQLSGGQRQRVLIAIALIGEPELIVADEPTSGLDVTVQKLVLDLLDEIVTRTGVSVILVTHDLAVAAERSDRIAVLSRGRIVEEGPTARITEAPRSPYTRRLLDAVPRAGARKLPASPGIQPALDGERLGTPHVRVEGLEKTYASRRRRGGTTVHATRGVSFEIGRGRTYGLVGQSGSGKSTIARLVAGIDRPDGGDVLVDRRSLTKGSRGERREVARGVQYVFQNPYGSLDPRQSIRQVIAEPLEGAGLPARGSEADARIAEALEAVALPAATASRRPTELSGGQRQRVAIARAIVTRPALLVLDEPVSALDVSVQAQVLQLLVDVQREYGTTYLFISHDLAVISQISDVVGVLQAGELLEEGAPAQLLENPGHEITRRLVDAIPHLRPAG